ncbi:MAG: phosphodiester glycosidase family protein [Verrucomicrobia bacterium]|nr:phosphodiester glycosidase family protein [Verrucomicrobiota bacterium]
MADTAITLAKFAAVLLVGLHSTVSGEITPKTFRGTEYLIVQAPTEDVRLHWKGADGRAIGTLERLKTILEKDGRTVDMVMNAGIYTNAPAPEGLHVEGGKELVPLNTNDGAGNFYLKPNGVFFIDENDRARVVSTDDYQKLKVVPRLAAQSGPLLLRGGKVHPKFDKASKNKLIRNGVGVDKEGRIWFASVTRTNDNVTSFFDFAELFRSLGCEEALYLDGTISQMEAGSDKPGAVQSVNFVGIFSVSRKKK